MESECSIVLMIDEKALPQKTYYCDYTPYVSSQAKSLVQFLIQSYLL